MVLVLLGVGLRCWHYLRNPAVWHDEGALIANVIGKDFGELLGPLYFAEAAPPLFLWLEKAIGLLLGDGPFALRLLPMLASCAAVALLAVVAQRTLPARAALLAVLLFATSETLCWHACEAKSYALDVFAAVLLLAGAMVPLPKRLTGYALLAPPLILLCFPACFLYGGVLAALLPEVMRSRQRGIWLRYGLLTLAVFGTFALLIAGPVQAQRCEVMTSDWLTKFPPWDRPASVPGWAVLSSLEIVRYSLKPLGQLLAPLAVLGAVWLWRGGQRKLIVMLVLPISLALVAACLGGYPYGGARVLAYAVPAVVLLVAAGADVALSWLAGRGRAVALALTVMLGLSVASGMYRAVVPWVRADSGTATDFILAQRQPGDVVVANDWEFAYYFRHLGDDFHLAMDDPFEPGHYMVTRSDWHTPFTLTAHAHPAAAERIWVVAKSPTAAGRRAYLDAIPAEPYHICERRDFPRVTVLLLRRNPHAQFRQPE